MTGHRCVSRYNGKRRRVLISINYVIESYARFLDGPCVYVRVFFSSRSLSSSKTVVKSFAGVIECDVDGCPSIKIGFRLSLSAKNFVSARLICEINKLKKNAVVNKS